MVSRLIRNVEEKTSGSRSIVLRLTLLEHVLLRTLMKLCLRGLAIKVLYLERFLSIQVSALSETPSRRRIGLRLQDVCITISYMTLNPSPSKPDKCPLPLQLRGPLRSGSMQDAHPSPNINGSNTTTRDGSHTS